MGWDVDEGHSSVAFAAFHMGLATVRGVFTKYEVRLDFDEEELTRSSVEATIDASSILSFNESRDEQLLSERYLNVAEYPTISFKSSRIEPRGDGYALVGDLTVRGITREVELDTTFNGEATNSRGNLQRGFSARGNLSRYDFGIHTTPVVGNVRFPVERVELLIDVALVKR